MFCTDIFVYFTTDLRTFFNERFTLTEEWRCKIVPKLN